jgi:hypothetical protein
MSSGIPAYPSGDPAVSLRAVASTSVASPVVTVAVIAVTVFPGEIALTRIPNGASSFATDFVRPMTPCLAAV